MLSLKDLIKEELRRLLQTLHDMGQNDSDRPIGVTVNISSLSREDLEEVLSQVKPEVKTRRIWYSHQPTEFDA